MKQKAKQVLGFCSLLIDILPLIVYPMLIFQKDGDFRNFVPYAIYYAFRYSSLILFRDWEHSYPELGKIGLIAGSSGAVMGLFGALDPLFWQLSAVGLGIGSTLFPTAIRQNSRSLKRQNATPKKSSNSALFKQLVVVLGFLTGIVILHSPVLCFTILVLANVLGFYYYPYRSQKLTRPTKIHWYNYGFASVLCLAMFAIGVSRRTGQDAPITWGIILLATCLLFMLSILVVNWRQKSKQKAPLYYRKALLYGICGQYWTVYSTIFIGAQYGMKMYAGVIVAYLLAIIFGKLFAQLLIGFFKRDTLSLCLGMTMLGLLLTFWLPTYFFGIFLIRTFTKYVSDLQLAEFELQTQNYQTSYINNYYYSLVGGLISQLVMWTSLFFALQHGKISDVLTAYASHEPSLHEFSGINAAHIVLAGYMSLYLLWVFFGKLKVDRNAKKA